MSISNRYLYTYQQAMPIEQLVKSVCNYKQAYTQFGGLRPFGVAFVFAGWDQMHGFQLYQSDPSGNFSGWKATVIGESVSWWLWYFEIYIIYYICVWFIYIMT